MKKFIAMILALVMVFALCACGNNGDGNDTKKEAGVVTADDLKEGFTLKVGFDPEFPPFGYLAADGSYDGFDLALAKEVCNRLGWGFEAVPINWDAKTEELKAGNVNCLWNGFTYTGREDQFTWSDPYYENEIVMVVKADSGITSFADLAGKKVMAQADSSAVTALNRSKLKDTIGEVVELGDYQMGFMELDQGSVDAVAVDIGVAISQMNKTGNEDAYVILNEKLSPEQYAIGFLLGNEALRDAVSAELKNMADDGTMLKIARSSDYVQQGLVVDSLCMISK